MNATPSILPDLATRKKLARQLKKDPAADQGVCDGFRIPDQAVLRFRGTPEQLSQSSMTPVSVFEGGSCITSYFWLVPKASVEAFLEKLDQATTATLPGGCNPEPEDGALACVWESPACDVSLVAWLAAGDFAADFDGCPEADFDAFDGVVPLMFGGNDNGPCQLLQEWPEGKVFDAGLKKLLTSAITKEAREEALEVWAEESPELMRAASKRPKP